MECKHQSLQVLYVYNDKGSVQLEICDNLKCAKIIRATCEHIEHNWDDRNNPSCLLCRLDLT